MLTMQIDELRKAARNIQGNLGRCYYRRKDIDEMHQVSDMLREAANTIESLRDRLQADVLGSGTCELHDCDGSFSAVNRPVWRCDCGAFMTQYTDATTYHKPRFCPNCGARIRKAVER